MDLFSISQLGRFSGLKPHTIRAWEARYNALKPARSHGNTRYYDGVQMKRLLNLVSLVKAGYKASEVGGLSDEKLHLLLESVFTTRHNTTEDYFISQLIAAGLTYDEARFEKAFAHCITRYRLKNTYQYVLLPMLERIGLMWRCDKTSPTQEHFVSNLIRRKLFTAADSLPPPDRGADKWLLFLPEGEFHELGLLVAYNLVRLSGHHAIYLGANVPFAALAPAMNEIRPDRVLLFTLHPDLSRPVLHFLDEMEKSFKGKKLYVAGNPARTTGKAAYRRVQWLSSVEDLTKVLSLPEGLVV